MKTLKKSATYNNAVCFKFRVPLRVDPIVKEVKQEWNLQLLRLLKLPILNAPSDQQRPFYGGSSRMEIKNITLYIKPAFKVIVYSFGIAVIETLEIQ